MQPLCRFALYDYNGDPKAHYLVQRKEILPDESTVAPEVTHHIFVVDRSGSMYYDMEALRSMLEKLLTLAEYKDSAMLATLISYSSSGDYTVHFSRKTVADIMRPGSAEVESIRQLRVTGLTCVSQALEATKAYIKPGETTGISLHSDGYANDRSPAIERREIDRICGDLAKLPGVFVNTIAYSSYSDFKLLAAIANSMNGKCVQAGSVKEVFDALHDTSSLLSGRMAPAIEIPLEGADYFTFVSHSAGRVNGSSYDTVLLGLKPEDDKAVYWFTEVTEAEYLDSGAPVAREGELLEPVYAFAMAKLAEGQLNTAKFALISTRDAALIPTHYRALTAPALAAFYADVQTALFKPTKRAQLAQYGLGLHKKPLMALLAFLDQHKMDLQIDMDDLASGYQRQGIQRKTGSRAEDGSIETSGIKSRIKPDWEKGVANCGGFDLNNNTASVNVLCVRPIEIFRPADGDDAIREVGGVKLDELSSFRNYTLVSDGALNVDSIRLRIGSKRVHRQLVKDGVFADGAADLPYDPAAWYTVRLDDLPLVDFAQPFDPDNLTGTFMQLARCKSVVSLLSALLKGQSDKYTAEQLEALKEHDITGALYYSPRTTNPYTDKTEALNAGLIDSRVSFKIDLGSTQPQILSRGQLHSGNKMLQRFYAVTVAGTAEKKPTWPLWWSDKVAFAHKKLSARTKITPIDDLMKPIYDAFLGLGNLAELTSVLLDAGLDNDQVAAFTEAMRGNQDPEDAVEIFTDTLKALQRHSEAVFDSRVRPLVFYIGATGLLPDELDTVALTAEQVTERYPQLKIGKSEQEGTFFALEDGTLLSVYAKSVTFSVDRQSTAAQAAK